MPTFVTDERSTAAHRWAQAEVAQGPLKISMVSGDASFRRYFRVHHVNGQTWVVMDAPPDKEDVKPFIDIASRLRSNNLHAPEVLASDLINGYLLLEDLGDTLYREVLERQAPEKKIPALLKLLQTLGKTRVDDLPAYHRGLLLQEMELFTTWFFQTHRGVTLSCRQWDVWENFGTLLLNNAAAQPQVFVHRDFHSCNLLELNNTEIGVIDFQDAVRGPLTYDFASLIWDRYLTWPREQLLAWMEEFRGLVAPEVSAETWVRWCDWMGLQRNIKIVGIFCRLHYRDNKAGYLDMIPQFWGYCEDTLQRYPEFDDFRSLLKELQCAP